MNYTIFFTNQCNMDCTYCYECNKMVRSTSYDVLDGIVNFIVEKQRSCSDKTVSIVTHGGEPLIEFDKIQYFIKRLNEKVKNVQYIITTNATLLTDLMIDFLSQHYSEISVSIDGIQSAHDANRVFANKKGSYAVVVEKAKKLLEKRSDVKARMTINPQTASTLYESVKHLLDLGFTTIVPVIDTFCNDWTENDIVAFTDTYVIGHQQVCDQSVLVAVHQILSDIMGWGDNIVVDLNTNLFKNGLIHTNKIKQLIIDLEKQFGITINHSNIKYTSLCSINSIGKLIGGIVDEKTKIDS